MAPSRMVTGGRPPPPTAGQHHYFFFFLAFFFIERLTSFLRKDSQPSPRCYLPFFFFFVAFFFTESPPSAPLSTPWPHAADARPVPARGVRSG
jgi:hypothetical protein